MAEPPMLFQIAVLACSLFTFTLPLFAQAKPDKDYLAYVVSESADKIALIRFGPHGARIDHQLDTGDMPVDIDGPHGIVISPDRKFYYVAIAHGRPFGSIWKYGPPATAGGSDLLHLNSNMAWLMIDYRWPI